MIAEIVLGIILLAWVGVLGYIKWLDHLDEAWNKPFDLEEDM